MRRVARLLVLAILVSGPFAVAPPADAGEPRIMSVRVVKIGKSAYEFHVRVAHLDDSWEHYVDRWEVVGPAGTVVGTRILHHPHIGEPAFTRSLRPVIVPEGTEHVILRVHDRVHGYGREKLVRLPTHEKRDTGWQ